MTGSSNLDQAQKVNSKRGEGFRDKVYLALIVALLSFMGGAGGTLLASNLEVSKWQREMTFNIKKETVTKRMELLERTIRAINQLQILDLYQSASKYSFVEGEDNIRSGKMATPALKEAIGSLVKLKEAQTELATVMTLDLIYFGPKTNKAVTELQKALATAQQWWRVDQRKTQGLLDAIGQELQFGIMDNQKGDFTMNPAYLVVIVNLLALIWAIRSWRKGIREKWMNNLRDSASDLLGAAERIYLDKHINKMSDSLSESMSLFKNKQHKLLLLFESNSKTYNDFKSYSSDLQIAADRNEGYRDKEIAFSALVSNRLQKEWGKIKSFL